jgi:hypothetical protein
MTNPVVKNLERTVQEWLDQGETEEDILGSPNLIGALTTKGEDVSGIMMGDFGGEPSDFSKLTMALRTLQDQNGIKTRMVWIAVTVKGETVTVNMIEPGIGSLLDRPFLMDEFGGTSRDKSQEVVPHAGYLVSSVWADGRETVDLIGVSGRDTYLENVFDGNKSDHEAMEMGSAILFNLRTVLSLL